MFAGGVWGGGEKGEDGEGKRGEKRGDMGARGEGRERGAGRGKIN